MKPDLFFERFRVVSRASNGVQRIRELILQLAVTGRLATHSGSTTADALIDDVEKLRDQLIDSGEIVRWQRLPDVGFSTELPKVPDHWRWIRLGNLTSKLGSGSTPRGGSKVYVSSGVAFLRSQNIWNDGIRLDDVVYIPPDVHDKMSGTRVLPNDVLLNITGASLGRCAKVPDAFPEANVSQHVTIVRSLIPELRHFIHICLLSPMGQSMIWGRQVGMAREGLSKKVLEQFEIPLPPLEEQKRIVAKVDELMGLCDRLESQLAERTTLLPLLSQANHARFVEEPTEENLASLFSQGTLVPEDLRETIFSLSIAGALSTSDAGDGETDMYLKMISGHRDHLIQAGAAKRARILTELDSTKCELKIPLHWKWVRLGEIAIDFRYGTSKKCDYATEGIGVLRIPNLKDGVIESSDLKFGNLTDNEKEDLRLSAGDLLFIRSNGSESLVGRCFLVSEKDESYAFAGYIVRARMLAEAVDPRYVQIAMESSYLRRQIVEPIRTTSGVKNINTKELANLVFPLPPLPEQRRIVRRAGELSTQIERLKTLRLKVEAAGAAFAQSAVESTVRIDSSMETRVKPPRIRIDSMLVATGVSNDGQNPQLSAIMKDSTGSISARELWLRSGLPIDEFYHQLKTEIDNGWIAEPEPATVKEVEAD